VGVNWLAFNDYNCAQLHNVNSYSVALTDTMTSWHQKDGFATGNPKPPYIPVCTPWIDGQRVTNALVPSSTAQVRRPTNKANSLLGLGANGNYVSVDNPLGTPSSPDEVTASVVRMAVKW